VTHNKTFDPIQAQLEPLSVRAKGENMLDRSGRISEAAKQLHRQKTKDVFLKLVAEYPKMSVFWDEEEGSATLEDDDTRINIS